MMREWRQDEASRHQTSIYWRCSCSTKSSERRAMKKRYVPRSVSCLKTPSLELRLAAGQVVKWSGKVVRVILLVHSAYFCKRCPHPGLLKEYAGREAEVLAGLTGAHTEETVKAGIRVPDGRAPGSAGEIDDGFGVLLKTLEDFPYKQFGMSVGNTH